MLKTYLIAVLFIFTILLSLPSCEEEKPVALNSEDKRNIDTLYSNQLPSLRQQIDSICDVQHDSILRIQVDSILKKRLNEIERQRERFQKRQEQKAPK